MTQKQVQGAVYSFDDLHHNKQGFPQFCRVEKYETPYQVYQKVQERANSDLEQEMYKFFFTKVSADSAYADNSLGQGKSEKKEPYVVGRLAERQHLPLFFRLGLSENEPVLQAIYIGKGSAEKRDVWMFEASQRRHGLVYVHRDRTAIAKKTLGVHAARIERLLGIKMTRQLLTEYKL